MINDHWVECYYCGGEGFSYHDCGEDTCVCLQPENNMMCDICSGAGGWYASSDCDED
tara:strand:- start:969 stop:1139 length:171 start_codon:yes stop_codon:yes gene_type:complete